MFTIQYSKQIIVVFLVLLMSACSSLSDNTIIVLISPDGEKMEFQVEIADEDHERKQGLMHREHLAEGTGMLFVFDTEKQLSFWMKNTQIPLDILFFTEAGEFVSWTSMEPCIEDPCTRYKAAAQSKYALEVPIGTAERIAIRQGWRILLE